MGLRLGNETKEETIGCTIEQLVEVVGEWMGHTEKIKIRRQ
jgi:hypothetical protein